MTEEEQHAANRVWESELRAKYPSLFAGYHDRRHIELDQGWHAAIETALAQFELIRTTFGAPVTISLIKEKLGTLRFHWDATGEVEPGSRAALVNGILTCIADATEYDTSQVCEVCGEYASAETAMDSNRARCIEHSDRAVVADDPVDGYTPPTGDR